MIDSDRLSREMVLTTIMLVGGTPVVLYGEEIGQDQVRTREVEES